MARKVEIVPATATHIAQLVGKVREADQREFYALGRTPRQAMEYGLKFSDQALTGMVDGEPVCIFGVVPMGFMLSGDGRPWMVGSTDLDRYALLFLRRCRKQVERMFAKYAYLHNHVAADNEMAIGWLKWLDFTVDDEPVPYGPKGALFYRFTRGAA